MSCYADKIKLYKLYGEQTRLISERIMDKLRGVPIILDKKSMKFNNITLSIGIVEWQSSMNTVQFRKKSDEAMYNSKRNGRNKVTVF